ncbi:RNase P subunit p30-domain-containing protein [Lipomyces arxii]|uniref:RNase P subunit p30-domain-containing protein n=1 Tax=Lipomyces arxii TaxID=56418 RepID=UPI0034CF4D4C
MFYDLCIPWPNTVTKSSSLEYTKITGPVPDLFKTVAILHQFGYRTIAYNSDVLGALNSAECNITTDIFAAAFPDTEFLSRATVLLDDTAQAQGLIALGNKFDILAVRPATEKLLLAACTSLDIDIISLDLSQRLPFYLRHRTIGAAIARGIKIEICYSASTRQGDNNARRNLISNAAALFRATRGKGIVISSGAVKALECRGPYDVANLATIWGFTQEKGKHAIAEDARGAVVHARMRRKSFKQVIEVIEEDTPDTQEKPELKRTAPSTVTTPLNSSKNKRQKTAS